MRLFHVFLTLFAISLAVVAQSNSGIVADSVPSQSLNAAGSESDVLELKGGKGGGSKGKGKGKHHNDDPITTVVTTTIVSTGTTTPAPSATSTFTTTFVSTYTTVLKGGASRLPQDCLLVMGAMAALAVMMAVLA